MRLPLLTLVLSPVLLIQGKRVKKNTPRLPEAAGQRCGISGNGQQLSILILGDSAAAGVGVSHQDDALTGQLVRQLATAFQVHWCLQATTGHTTEDVIQRVKALEPQQYDVVVTSVGVNDVTRLLSPRKWIRLQQQLLEQIQLKFQPRLILPTSVPPMHLFSALPQPLRWHMGLYAKQMNKELAAYLDSLPDNNQPEIHQTVWPLTRNQRDTPLAEDRFHPGAEVYQLWAQILSDAIKKHESYGKL
ncbi:SGNH/GDSL hydrolase family protein [Alkanindiges sp. WGS2144]|uniref:SGNH/GDSL hydrolase family protein n=1 Tax=Alkanindiges sp. WGS2144 TaxID=3366808 RepID=UPI00375394F9